MLTVEVAYVLQVLLEQIFSFVFHVMLLLKMLIESNAQLEPFSPKPISQELEDHVIKSQVVYRSKLKPMKE